jgi:hypothetical protein
VSTTIAAVKDEAAGSGGRVAIASSAPHKARDRRYVPDRAGEQADHALRDRRGRSRGPGSPRPRMPCARLGPSRGRARGPKDTVGRDGTPSPEPANELSMEPVETVFGESFSMEERLVVAPAGRLHLRRYPQIAEGDFVLEGEVLAEVLTPSGESVGIQSPCDGWVMGFLLHDGFPVRAMEPVLWLQPQ